MCEFPYCHDTTSYVYIGVGLCEKHWNMISDTDDKDRERQLLKKIGLRRDENGSVVEGRLA